MRSKWVQMADRLMRKYGLTSDALTLQIVAHGVEMGSDAVCY